MITVPEGGFGYLPGTWLPFSNGVVALDGCALTRVRVRGAPPLAEGLAFAAAFIAAQTRPLAALAAVEIRSPAPMSREAFTAFNAEYAGLLRVNGLGSADSFPIARSNMAPLFDPPATNTLFAFTYAAPMVVCGGQDFVISGKPENTEEPPGVIAAGDVSAAGMMAKAAFVVAQLRARVAELGAIWGDVTGAQAYTVQPLAPIMDLLGASGLGGVGLSLFPGYPPVIGFEFEIDVRAVSVERMV